MSDSFSSHGTLTVGGREYRIARLGALADRGFSLDRLPYSLKILLENLLRREDGTVGDGGRHRARSPTGTRRPSPPSEIAFMPARVLLQDFTGVPAVVDLAAMRDAMGRHGRRRRGRSTRSSRPSW